MILTMPEAIDTHVQLTGAVQGRYVICDRQAGGSS